MRVFRRAPLYVACGLLLAAAPISADVWTGTQADQMISFDDDEYAQAVQIVANGATNTLHLLWGEDAPSVRELHYGRSTDEGETWSSTTSDRVISFPDGNALYEECDVAASLEGVLIVVWSEDHAGAREVHYGVSLDDGLTWSCTAGDLVLSDPATIVDTGIPSIVCDRNGVFHVVWQQAVGGVAEVHYGRSTDNGATWSCQSADRVISFPDGNGAITPQIVATWDRLYVFWRENESAGVPRIHVGISEDWGNTWSSTTADRAISPAPTLMTDLAAAAGLDEMYDGVHVIYRASYDTASPYHYEIYSSSTYDGGVTWTGETHLTPVSHDEGGGRSASNPDIITQLMGQPMAVWDEEEDLSGTNEQHVSWCWGTWWTGAVADSVISFPDGEDGYRPSVAMLPYAIVPGDGSRTRITWVAWTEFAGGATDNYEVHLSAFNMLYGGVTEPLPHTATLVTAGPSPSHETTHIRLALPAAGPVRVEIFNSEGRLVWRQGGFHDAGDLTLAWSGTDLQGRRVHPGRYQVRVITVQGIRQAGVVRL
jgi:hypothetical protein